jgi:hypothetical protein
VHALLHNVLSMLTLRQAIPRVNISAGVKVVAWESEYIEGERREGECEDGSEVVANMKIIHGTESIG